MPSTTPERTEIDSPDELLELIGQPLGISDWVEISEEEVDDFARVTGERRWMQVDPELGPFDTNVTQGFRVLSICSRFINDVLRIRGQRAVNYGLERARFMSPVRIGSRIRADVKLLAAEHIEGGVHFRQALTIEIEHEPKPACVAFLVSRVSESRR